MYNLGDDNELDRASREAAGRYAPPGDPDWQALSAELDKVLPVEKKKRRIFFFWWLLPVLLIGGGTAYWLIQKENTSEVITVKEPVITQAEKKDALTISPAESSINAQKENSHPAADQTEKPIATLQINTSAGKKNIVKADERKDITGNGSLTINSVKNKKVYSPELSKGQPDINQAIAKTSDQPVKQDQPVTTAAPGKTSTDPAKETAKDNTDQPAQPVKDDNTSVKEEKNETLTQAAPQQADVKTVITTKKLAQQRGKGFSFGILAGIDKSTVKFTYADDAGMNMGFLAGYHFSDRLSLHTGVIYTQKNYKVAGADFTAPKGSWASYYKIDKVEGYCRMWEIPLMARYTVSEFNRNNIFLSTGLSSYFMTSENYDYTYFTNSGLLASRNSAYNSTDTHIMSILHLSAGFENRISRNWSIQVEPYAKIPLGGVGFGNIRLSSFGLNFSVQHRQPSKK